MFAAPGFFRSIEVREFALLDEAPRPVLRAYDEAAMEELALRAVGEILGKTPHEQQVAEASTNPFGGPPAEAVPIDFGDLLGDQAGFGAGASLFALGGPAEGEAPAGPANPFAGFGAPPEPAPVGAAAPAEADVALAEPPGAADAAADAAPPAAEPGIGAEAEAALLAEWQADPDLAGLRSITVAAGGSAYLTFLPLRPGRYGLSNLRPAAAFGMRGTLVILAPGVAPADAEVAVAAADLALLRVEAQPADADLDLLENEAAGGPPVEAPPP